MCYEHFHVVQPHTIFGFSNEPILFCAHSVFLCRNLPSVHFIKDTSYNDQKNEENYCTLRQASAQAKHEDKQVQAKVTASKTLTVKSIAHALAWH
jgi:hypothetical protein